LNVLQGKGESTVSLNASQGKGKKGKWMFYTKFFFRFTVQENEKKK
jgi:hypothetical protein